MIRNSSSDKEAKTIDCFWLQASRSTARIVIDVDQTVPLTYLNRLPGVRMAAVLAHVAERTACELPRIRGRGSVLSPKKPQRGHP